MNTGTQEILNTLLVIGFLVTAVCVVITTYYLVKALKSITSLADTLVNSTQSIRDKIQMKALIAIPALVVALVSRIFTKRR